MKPRYSVVCCVGIHDCIEVGKMSAQLYALGRWCFRHAKLVLASWLVIVLAVGGAALAFGGGFADVFKIPSSPSQVALDKLKMTFPQGAMTQAAAIFVAPEGGRVDDFRGVIEDTGRKSTV